MAPNLGFFRYQYILVPSHHLMQSYNRRGHQIQAAGGAQQYQRPGRSNHNHIPTSNGNGSSGGVHAEVNNNNGRGRNMTQPTPLFERLVTEEVQELKAYARIIENQNRRLGELERVHGDLEARLELESRGRAQLETTLEEQERAWALRFQQLEEDRDHWKDVVKAEQAKNARLIDQVVRKDQDIHRMLQRKVRTLSFLACPISTVSRNLGILMQTLYLFATSMTIKGNRHPEGVEDICHTRYEMLDIRP